MATNPPKGDGHRNGAVKERSQVFNPQNERFVKRDIRTGKFMDVKSDGKKFKGGQEREVSIVAERGLCSKSRCQLN